MGHAMTEQPALDRDYVGFATSLGSARADVALWLTHRGADEEAVQRAALIVSELASNALQATPGGTYHVQVTAVDDGVVDIAVRNRRHGGVPPPRSRWTSSDVRAPRGRGLSIVEKLSQDMAVWITRNDVTVCARMIVKATSV